jgi:hypothetical protein
MEIMYPAQPTAISTTQDGFLLVYSETHIDVFDATAGKLQYRNLLDNLDFLL